MHRIIEEWLNEELLKFHMVANINEIEGKILYDNYKKQQSFMLGTMGCYEAVIKFRKDENVKMCES